MEIDVEDFRPYIGQYVAIGVPHSADPMMTYFHYGTLIKISGNVVQVQTKKGTMFIDVHHIVEFQTMERQ